MTTDFERALLGWQLMTVHILYHRPDFPSLLQEFTWQEVDRAPDFPVLNRFLHFWETSIEAKLHSVRVGTRALIQPAELRLCGSEFRLN